MTGHLKDNYDYIRWRVITYRSASRRAATSNELLQIWLTSYRNNSNDYTGLKLAKARGQCLARCFYILYVELIWQRIRPSSQLSGTIRRSTWYQATTICLAAPIRIHIYSDLFLQPTLSAFFFFTTPQDFFWKSMLVSRQIWWRQCCQKFQVSKS